MWKGRDARHEDRPPPILRKGTVNRFAKAPAWRRQVMALPWPVVLPPWLWLGYALSHGGHCKV